MPVRKLLIPTLCAFVLTSLAIASPPQLSGDAIARHIERLASDEFEGRFPASEGERKTTTYIREQFEASGLSPMPNGQWLQPVELVGRTLDGDVRLDARKDDERVSIELGKDALIGSPHARERVQIDGAELVFVGHGIVAPEYDWDDYAGVDLRGKVAVAVMADPGRLSEDESFFKGRALTLYGTTSQKAEEAARHGARGLVLIHDADIIGYPWSTLEGAARSQKWGLADPGEDEPKPEFQMILRREVADRLLRLAGSGYDARLSAAAERGFRAQPLGVSLSVDFHQKLEHSRTHNVIGVLPGSERPDEYLLYTAHWDHVGIGAEVDGDRIYNGAVDNATGTAVLMALADAFAHGPRPARSIVFIATAAEEQGLLGAFHYAGHPVFPLAQTVGVINMDALFPFGDFNSMTVVALGSSELEDYLRVAAAAEGRGLEADPAPEQGAFFRSDHYPFAKKGVPALFAVGGPASEPEPSPELMARFDDYLRNGYHKPADEYDAATWDMRGIAGDARIFFRMGTALANDKRWPTWALDSEFRGLRDRQTRALGKD